MITPLPILDYEPAPSRPSLLSKFQRAFAIIEILLWGIALVGMLLKYESWEGGSELLILSISTLIMLYLVAPILVFGSNGWRRHLGSHATGIALALAISAFLFKFLRWQGAIELAILAVMPCSIAIFITFIFGIINHKKRPAD